jgi:hypothetical protein
MRGAEGTERLAPRYALGLLAALAYALLVAALYGFAGSIMLAAAILVGGLLVGALVARAQARRAPRLAGDRLVLARRVVPLADVADARARPWGVELRLTDGRRLVLWDVRAAGQVAARVRDAAPGHAADKR